LNSLTGEPISDLRYPFERFGGLFEARNDTISSRWDGRKIFSCRSSKANPFCPLRVPFPHETESKSAHIREKVYILFQAHTVLQIKTEEQASRPPYCLLSFIGKEQKEREKKKEKKDGGLSLDGHN
jgi:hypothetical protein